MWPRIAPLAAFLTALMVFAIALRLGSAGHPFALPLDDAYIYLQFARTAAFGHPGAYVPGAELTSGVTSPLWAAVLTLLATMLRGVGANLTVALPVAALGACAGCLAGTFWLLFRLATRLQIPAWAAPTPLVLALITPLWVFGVLNGMETGLYALALVAGAWVLAGGSVFWLLLLALARPEGAVLALAILGYRVVRAPARPGRSALLVALVAGACLVLPWILTGHAASAWTAKALSLEPKTEVREFYRSRLLYFAGRCLWFGLSGERAQPPLDLAGTFLRPEAWPAWASAAFLGMGAILTLVQRRGRAFVLLWICASVTAVLVVSWDAQFYRYLVPAYLLLLLAATVGWFGPRTRRPLRAIGLILGFAVILGAFTAPRGLGTTLRWLYRGECERMESTQLRVGDWIDTQLPPKAKVATHDVGAIAFRGKRPVVDLVGLVTPALAGAYRHGEGALWEALDALPPERRPTHAAVVPAWMPYLARTGLFETRLFELSPTPSDRTPMGQSFEVWRLSWPGDDPARWPDGDLANIPRLHGPAAGRTQWRVTDRLDVADRASEAAHAYRDSVGSGMTVVRELGFGLSSQTSRATALDGGRDVMGKVEFTLRAEVGLSALLVLRATTTGNPQLAVGIGEWSVPLRLRRGENAFREMAILIPGHVTDQAPEGVLHVRVLGSGYRAFHWWLLQSSDLEEIENAR